MSIEDKYSISGFKSFAVIHGISYLQKKIKAEDLDEIIDKIDKTFPDKHSLSVLKDTQILVSRFFLRLNIKIRELQDGKKEVVKKEENPKLHKKPKKPLRRRFKN